MAMSPVSTLPKTVGTYDGAIIASPENRFTHFYSCRIGLEPYKIVSLLDKVTGGRANQTSSAGIVSAVGEFALSLSKGRVLAVRCPDSKSTGRK